MPTIPYESLHRITKDTLEQLAATHGPTMLHMAGYYNTLRFVVCGLPEGSGLRKSAIEALTVFTSTMCDVYKFDSPTFLRVANMIDEAC